MHKYRRKLADGGLSDNTIGANVGDVLKNVLLNNATSGANPDQNAQLKKGGKACRSKHAMGGVGKIRKGEYKKL